MHDEPQLRDRTVPTAAPEADHYHVVLRHGGVEIGRGYAPDRARARCLGRRLRRLHPWDVGVYESACFEERCAPSLARAWPRDDRDALLDPDNLEPLTDPERELRYVLGTEDEYWAFDFAVLPDAVQVHAIVKERDSEGLADRLTLTSPAAFWDRVHDELEAAWRWLADHHTFEAGTAPAIDLQDAERATERLLDALAAAIGEGR